MSLRLWLPLNGSLTSNQGLDENNISGTQAGKNTRKIDLQIPQQNS